MGEIAACIQQFCKSFALAGLSSPEFGVHLLAGHVHLADDSGSHGISLWLLCHSVWDGATSVSLLDKGADKRVLS